MTWGRWLAFFLTTPAPIFSGQGCLMAARWSRLSRSRAHGTLAIAGGDRCLVVESADYGPARRSGFIKMKPTIITGVRAILGTGSSRRPLIKC